ncbi:MAG: SGNH/GDSL hydrolase family protein [Ardenticatenaceae bacterium]|nr:SGNH/GDSL hydrolase family protein [Ardenticatenaceae bacterium]
MSKQLSFLRIIGYTAILFALCNLFFWLGQPGLTDQLGELSLYNSLFPGRSRLPYGENITESYNLTLNNIPAMFASHKISREKSADEFRVLVLGDSATWGWLQTAEETVVAQLNEHKLQTADGRQVVFYNLGYPVLSLTKDLLLLDEGLNHDPDMILWLVTLESMALEQQGVHPLVQENGRRSAALGLEPDSPAGEEPWWAETIVGQRRDLADLLRLQLIGPMWAATGIDQEFPDQYDLRQNDFENDAAWHGLLHSDLISRETVAFEVLTGGLERAKVPVIVVNEPIFIADGQNSDVRYNSLYPRWAYDQYRKMMANHLQELEIPYFDFWDAIPAAEFTDSPVHLTPAGARQFARLLAEALGDKIEIINNDPNRNSPNNS